MGETLHSQEGRSPIKIGYSQKNVTGGITPIVRGRNNSLGKTVPSKEPNTSLKPPRNGSGSKLQQSINSNNTSYYKGNEQTDLYGDEQVTNSVVKQENDANSSNEQEDLAALPRPDDESSNQSINSEDEEEVMSPLIKRMNRSPEPEEIPEAFPDEQREDVVSEQS